jgi:hypothetical protein
MENSIALLEKIRNKKIKPLPAWKFRLKEITVWGLFFLAVLIGALAFSVILFAIQQLDFNLVAHMKHSLAEFLLGLIPFFWIISLIVFLLIALFSIKNSKKGYKFTSLSLLGFCTALGILIGTLFFIGGGARWLENTFATNVSFYESIQERKTKMWTRPQDGHLSGRINGLNAETIELEDFNGKIWKIDIQEADIIPSLELRDGEKIRVIGNMVSENEFKAEKIRPWGGPDQINEDNRKK